MKKTDIAMIILIASVGVLVAYFVVQAIPGIGDAGEQSAQVKTAEPITDEIVAPDERIFNDDAINPTVEIIIGGDE